jgi:hypothetical protein
MDEKRIDTLAIAVWLSALLFAMGMSILVPHCYGKSPGGMPIALDGHVAPATASANTNMPIQGYGHATPATLNDLDEDSVPDHWNDPRYRHEARLQMNWIGSLLAIAAVWALIGRSGVKRSGGHA